MKKLCAILAVVLTDYHTCDLRSFVLFVLLLPNLWLLFTNNVFSRPYTNGRAIGTVLRPSVCLSSVVCDVMHCG